MQYITASIYIGTIPRDILVKRSRMTQDIIEWSIFWVRIPEVAGVPSPSGAKPF
jgi:hypothetical protein